MSRGSYAAKRRGEAVAPRTSGFKNALNAALDSKIGRKLRGVSVVDNVKNLNSAYNKRLPFAGSRFDPDDVVKVAK